MSLKQGDTVAVSGATGGVGSIAVQLAKRAGAEVIGIAGPANHEWLAAHGIKPVAYGDSLAGRLREVLIDAFIDTYGRGYVKLAIDLGVAPEHIDTIMISPPRSSMGLRARAAAPPETPQSLRNLPGWLPPVSWKCR